MIKEKLKSLIRPEIGKTILRCSVVFFVIGIVVGRISYATIVRDMDRQLLESAGDNAELSVENRELIESNNELKEDNGELRLKVEAAAPWFAMKDEEKKAIEKSEQERLAKEAEEKVKQEELKRVEAEKKEIEGIKYGTKTYEFKAINKNPDKYTGERATFEGEVVEIMENADGTIMRVNITPTSYGYSDTIMVMTTLDTGEIYEKEIIEMWGTLAGAYSYKSQAGWDITLPLFIAELIEY